MLFRDFFCYCSFAPTSQQANNNRGCYPLFLTKSWLENLTKQSYLVACSCIFWTLPITEHNCSTYWITGKIGCLFLLNLLSLCYWNISVTKVRCIALQLPLAAGNSSLTSLIAFSAEFSSLQALWLEKINNNCINVPRSAHNSRGKQRQMHSFLKHFHFTLKLKLKSCL